MWMGLFSLVLIIILPCKFLLRRERPSRIKSVRRICNMRDREHRGRFHSMPSGDSAAAGFFCVALGYLFNFPFIVISIPFTCLGRVYVHCHWFGDTLIGAIIGSTFSFIVFNLYFEKLSPPLFIAVM